MSSRIVRRLVPLFVAVVSLGACGSSPVLSPGEGVILAELSAPITTTRRDPADLHAVRVDGNRLEIDISHGGGCQEHTFALVHDGVFAESYPVQTGLTLLHDAHGDACRALIHRTLTFDLAPLRATYQAAYGDGPGVMIVYLHPPVPTSESGLSFRYEF